jgi:hypothetical protein
VYNPEIAGGKPMEFAFINGVLRSASSRKTWLPTRDQHHYFGYVMLGLMIRLTGVDRRRVQLGVAWSSERRRSGVASAVPTPASGSLVGGLGAVRRYSGQPRPAVELAITNGWSPKLQYSGSTSSSSPIRRPSPTGRASSGGGGAPRALSTTRICWATPSK